MQKKQKLGTCSMCGKGIWTESNLFRTTSRTIPAMDGRVFCKSCYRRV